MNKGSMGKGVVMAVLVALALVAVSPVMGADATLPEDDAVMLDAAADDEMMESEASERARLLDRWDVLRQERAELRRELARVERELRELAGQLWPDDAADSNRGGLIPRERAWHREWMTEEEWEALRTDLRERSQALRERLSQRLGGLGEDLLPWVPEAVVEGLADRTGHTPDEVRELIRSGAWEQLLRKGPGSDGEAGDVVEKAPSSDPSRVDDASRAQQLTPGPGPDGLMAL